MTLGRGRLWVSPACFYALRACPAPSPPRKQGSLCIIKWQARQWAAREVPEPGMGNWHYPAALRPLEQSPPSSVLLCHGPTGSAFRTWPGPKWASKEAAV